MPINNTHTAKWCTNWIMAANMKTKIKKLQTNFHPTHVHGVWEGKPYWTNTCTCMYI